MSSTYKTRTEQVRAYLRARPGEALSALAISRGTGLGLASTRETILSLAQAGHLVSSGGRPAYYRLAAEPAPPGRKPARGTGAVAAAVEQAQRTVPMPAPAAAGSGHIAQLRTHTSPGPLDPAILRPIVRPGAGGPALPGVRINPSIYDRRRP